MRMEGLYPRPPTVPGWTWWPAGWSVREQHRIGEKSRCADLTRFAETFVDLGNAEVMKGAWE